MVARRACDADIVVTGVTPESVRARAFLRAEIAGVRYVSFDRMSAVDVEAEFGEADMLLFVVEAAEAFDEERIRAVAQLARRGGMLVAAFVLADAEPAGPSALLAVLRAAADSILIVRDSADLQAVVTALR